MQKYKNKMK